MVFQECNDNRRNYYFSNECTLHFKISWNHLTMITQHAGDWAYEATNKHTYVIMTVMSAIMLVVFVLLLVIYKQIAPKIVNYGATKLCKNEYLKEASGQPQELQSPLLSNEHKMN